MPTNKTTSRINPERLLDAQVSSWVESLCQSHNVSDLELIAASKKKVKHYIISQTEEQGLGLDDITPLLAEALKQLNKQLVDSSPQEI
jgi:hypothetical protein